ncbi:MAG: hypothetical protein M1837_000285 [Sclerophora amabilis]|nr:MAG: hypothetical protein M1837_000285 [Sclerophora amabilis]
MDICASIEVSISLVSSTLLADQPLELLVSVRNTADYDVTLLKWGSPLDPRAGVLGIFGARDKAAKDGVIFGDVVRFSRMMPPSRDDLVEIGSKDQVETRVNLSNMPLLSGREYEVEATGMWKGVWKSSLANITGAMLEDFEGASTGEYASNRVAVMKL